MDRGVWGEGGEGAPGLVRARVALRVHVRPRATCAPHARYDAGAHNARTHAGGWGVWGEGTTGWGRLTSVNAVVLVCGPVLG